MNSEKPNPIKFWIILRGWGGFVLKEKLKAIKARLKVWNKEQFGDT